ncbi:unnamed protein product [marine sediment metagenome]|uniref:Uncharacterized protein n=1 Tax=marine sediment metagenome TaxID=412755 RepID=X0VRM9_9ZZZZ
MNKKICPFWKSICIGSDCMGFATRDVGVGPIMSETKHGIQDVFQKLGKINYCLVFEAEITEIQKYGTDTKTAGD